MTEHLYERNFVPSLDEEFTETVRDIVLAREPITVTGTLLRSESPLTREAIAAVIGVKTDRIDGVVAGLQEQGWLTAITERGLEKLELTVPSNT